jgi:HSP20 family protein
MALLPVRKDHDRSPEVVRHDPFGELEQMHRQLSEFLSSWQSWPGLLPEGFTPPADVEETDHAYTIEIELPGVKREDLDIEVSGRRVSVHGERKEKQRAGILRRRERTVGRFVYEVTLPGDIDDSAVEANLDEGVLSLVLPKPEHERPRKIQIRRPSSAPAG